MITISEPKYSITEILDNLTNEYTLQKEASNDIREKEMYEWLIKQLQNNKIKLQQEKK